MSDPWPAPLPQALSDRLAALRRTYLDACEAYTAARHSGDRLSSFVAMQAAEEALLAFERSLPGPQPTRRTLRHA